MWTQQVLGFFYSNYNSSYFYMELFWILRNLMLAAGFSVLQQNLAAQGTCIQCNAAHVLAIIIQGVLLISVIGYNYLRIFKSRADNFLHTLGIVVILLSYSASVLQTDEYAESITKVVLSMWFVYTIIVACVVGGSLLHKRLYKM